MVDDQQRCEGVNVSSSIGSPWLLWLWLLWLGLWFPAWFPGFNVGYFRSLRSQSLTSVL